jgi:hypothetical protein
MKTNRIKLEYEIMSGIYKDNGNSTHFDYHVNVDESTDNIKLDVVTYNPRHGSIMLLTTVKGDSSVDCLQKVLEYVKSHSKKSEKSYTVIWSKSTNSELNKSYFSSVDADSALSKFYYGKNDNDFIVHEVKLNPIA